MMGNDCIDEQTGLEMESMTGKMEQDTKQTFRAFINGIRAKPLGEKIHYFARIGLIAGKEMDGLGNQRLIIKNVELLISRKLSVWAKVIVESGGLPKNYNKIFHRVEVSGLEYFHEFVVGTNTLNSKGMLNSITLE